MTYRWIALIIIIVLSVLGVVGYRCMEIAAYPMGGGHSKDSPNGKFKAHASNMYDEDFWGNRYSYYKFQVDSKNGKNLRSIEILESNDPVDFREGNGQIMWATDSSSVIFGTLDNIIWSTDVP